MPFQFARNKNNAYLCIAVGHIAFGKRIVLWCNGSTAVFGSACLGSNPGKTTHKVVVFAATFFRIEYVGRNLSFCFEPLLFRFKGFKKMDFDWRKLVLGALAKFVIFLISFEFGNFGGHASGISQ